MDAEFTVINTRTRSEWESWKVDDGRNDWKSDNVSITDAGVTLRRELAPTYVAPKSIEKGPLGEPVDIDVDRCGNRYALGADGALYRASATESAFDRLACDGLGIDVGRSTPKALCVTDDTIYVARGPGPEHETGDKTDRLQVASVQALSTRLRQTRWVLKTAGDVVFRAPIRVVGGTSGECYILDRGRGKDDGFVARVNADGTATVVVADLQQPRDLTLDDQGELTVLDVGQERAFQSYTVSEITHSSRGATDTEKNESQERSGSRKLPVENATCIEAIGHGEFVVGVSSATTGERTLYQYTEEDESARQLTSFKQGCHTLRRGYGEDGGPRLYVIDDEGTRDVSVLEPTTGYMAGLEGHTGWLTTWFDLGAIQASLYRVSLTLGDQPPGTRVTLRYATTDRDISPEGPADEDAEDEPDDCWEARNQDGNGDSGTVRWTPVDESNPTDVLIEGKGQRFLWLGLELVGSQYTSPTVESVTVSLTHESYLEYLPTIYVEDEHSATFLERFLSIFEDTFGDFDHGIATLTEYFDPLSIPAAHLSWLGSWIASAEDDAWADTSKRTLIEEAPNLFKRRGTKRGLARLIEIYLEGTEPASLPWATVPDDDVVSTNDGGGTSADGGGGVDTNDASDDRATVATGLVSLVEHGDIVSVNSTEMKATTYGDSTKPITDDETLPAPFSDLVCCPQEFLVVLAPTVGAEARATVERIVDAERPAHTVSRTVTLSPWNRLGEYTYLGVNSYLPPRAFVVDDSRLGWNSVVGAREPGRQLGLGWESRLGEGIELL